MNEQQIVTPFVSLDEAVLRVHKKFQNVVRIHGNFIAARGSLIAARIECGMELLGLRARIEAGEAGKIGWWEWYENSPAAGPMPKRLWPSPLKRTRKLRTKPQRPETRKSTGLIGSGNIAARAKSAGNRESNRRAIQVPASDSASAVRPQIAEHHARQRMTGRKQYSWRHTVAVSNGLVRAARHNELLGDMLRAGPAATYAGLLHYARAKNYNAGWAAHSFKEIFGTWPRPQDRKGEATALPDFLIEEWAARRNRRQR